MEMTVGFPEMGSRFESVSFDPDLEIKMIKTVRTKITVCKLEQINAPHELVLIYQRISIRAALLPKSKHAPKNMPVRQLPD